jgi:hypothetical protein
LERKQGNTILAQLGKAVFPIRYTCFLLFIPLLGIGHLSASMFGQGLETAVPVASPFLHALYECQAKALLQKHLGALAVTSRQFDTAVVALALF